MTGLPNPTHRKSASNQQDSVPVTENHDHLPAIPFFCIPFVKADWNQKK